MVSLTNRCSGVSTYSMCCCVSVPGAQGKRHAHTCKAGHVRNVVCTFMHGILRYYNDCSTCCVSMPRSCCVSGLPTVRYCCVSARSLCAWWLLFVTPLFHLFNWVSYESVQWCCDRVTDSMLMPGAYCVLQLYVLFLNVTAVCTLKKIKCAYAAHNDAHIHTYSSHLTAETLLNFYSGTTWHAETLRSGECGSSPQVF